MFSQEHLIWITISSIIIISGCVLCSKYKPGLKKLMIIALIIGSVLEIVKFFSVAEIVPMVNPVIVEKTGSPVLEYIPTGEYTPYIPLEHLPIELCSLFIFFLILALVLKEGKLKKWLYSMMFAAGVIGAPIAILLPAITRYFDSSSEFFTKALPYQFFIYHSMIVVVAIYVGYCKEAALASSDWKKAVGGLLLLDLPTFYLNSILSSEIYYNDSIVGVTHRVNLFSSYVNPLGLVLVEKWQWILYLIIRLVLAVVLVFGLYRILKKKEKRDEHDSRQTGTD